MATALLVSIRLLCGLIQAQGLGEKSSQDEGTIKDQSIGKTSLRLNVSQIFPFVDSKKRK